MSLSLSLSLSLSVSVAITNARLDNLKFIFIVFNVCITTLFESTCEATPASSITFL